MKTKILVTGGAGYLGSILVSRLLDLNYNVTVFDSFRTKVASLTEHCHCKNLTIIRGDVRRINQWRSIAINSDIIIWLAAIVGAPACSKSISDAWNTNYDSVVELSTALDQQIVIYPCTNAGYETSPKSKYCNEESKINPTSEYAKSKLSGEQILFKWKPMNTISLRLATLFGMSPRMRIDLLVNDFVYRATRDKYLVLYQPNFMRNMIHVRDAARGFIHCIDNFSQMKGQIYNLGLPEGNITKRQLCEKIQQHIEDFYFVEHPYHADIDNRNFALDTSKIQSAGFTCTYNLDDGIDELIKGYQMLDNKRYCN